MSKVYIAAAKRTALGSFLGTLSTVSPSEFGAAVVKNIVEETKIDPSKIDEVISGNILPAGQGQGIGRQVAIKAGLPESVPGYAVNMVCGSGMKAVMDAFLKIKAGWANMIVAGGTESMSQAPMLLPSKARSGLKMGDVKMVDHMINDALWDAYNNIHMGVTAENIVDKHNISREAQDEFAFASQQKAIKAVDSGRFDDEIVPIEVKKRRETIVFDKDEYPNRRTTLEKLGTLRAVFRKGGSVTAGNASGINDGAAYLLVVSEEALKEHNLTPLVEIVEVDQAAIDPLVMGLGPVSAIRNVLNRSNMTLKDMELLELNEAFASQSIGVLTELSEEHGESYENILARTNVNGGAIALGHPVGCSGSRILVTLIHEMKKRNNKVGLASLCIGGGMGTAVIVKNV
jgi:acetyl-CoA C-acetyltransferase